MKDAADVFRFLRNAPQPTAMSEAAKLAFTRGSIAGVIFFNALSDAEVGKRLGLKAIKRDIIRKYRGHQHFEALSGGTLETAIWKIYRPVAHFLAVSCIGVAERGIAYPFPCALADLPQFLAVSEYLRLAGLQ